jgi:hypothetical protein
MTCMSAFEVQHQLQQLQADRARAWFAELVRDAASVADLDAPRSYE